MTASVVLVTPPDDIPYQDGFRILLVDLTPSQLKVVSDAFNFLETKETLITYIWISSQDINWLLDKKQKSQVIIFNADSSLELIVGYVSAQPNSYYFGILKTLEIVNKSSIYDKDQLIHILEKHISYYEKR